MLTKDDINIILSSIILLSYKMEKLIYRTGSQFSYFEMGVEELKAIRDDIDEIYARLNNERANVVC